MPYPSEHACRLNPPGNYEKFARKNGEINHDGKPIDVVYGIKGGKSEIQAYRYPKDKWTADAARSHCNSHDGSFEVATADSLNRKIKIVNGKTFYLNHLSGHLEFNLHDIDSSLKQLELKDDGNKILRLPRSTLLVGDGFYNNIWHPSEEIQKSYKTMEHQPFIINHADGVEHEIGWMEQVLYDTETKKLSAIPVLNLNTQYGTTALGFIRNRIMAGKTPETSVGFWATEANELIKNEDHITVRELEFDHDSLVSRGACGPSVGAGIGLHKNKENNASYSLADGQTLTLSEKTNNDLEERKMEEKDKQNYSLTKEDIMQMIDNRMKQIEQEKDIEIRKQKMSLLGAAILENDLEKAREYLEVLDMKKIPKDHEMLKRIETLENATRQRITDVRDTTQQDGSIKQMTKEQRREASLITGKGLCKFASTGERLNIHVFKDDNRIPDSLMTEVD